MSFFMPIVWRIYCGALKQVCKTDRTFVQFKASLEAQCHALKEENATVFPSLFKSSIRFYRITTDNIIHVSTSTVLRKTKRKTPK